MIGHIPQFHHVPDTTHVLLKSDICGAVQALYLSPLHKIYFNDDCLRCFLFNFVFASG